MVEILSGHHQSRGWLVLFDLGGEWNFPTIYSALLLFLAAAVLLFIGVERRRDHGADFRHWIALSMIFCFLGFDEVLSIHNSAKHLVPVWFRHFALFDHRWDLRWIVIGLPVTVVIAIVFLPFVAASAAKNRVWNSYCRHGLRWGCARASRRWAVGGLANTEGTTGPMLPKWLSKKRWRWLARSCSSMSYWRTRNET